MSHIVYGGFDYFLVKLWIKAKEMVNKPTILYVATVGI